MRASKAIYFVGLGMMLVIICARYLKDGSFWLDEASVAQSFRDLTLAQIFDRLVGSQSFPRLYFLLVRSAQEVFGYHTAVLRFFPFVFSLAATTIFLTLFRIRFIAAPALLVIALLLNLTPPSWFVYSAFLKQYTLDVFLALLPFCLSDDFYERTLARGEKPWKLALLALPILTSYTYVIPLLGRVAGFCALRLGARQGVSWRALVLLSGGIALCLAGLWITDLRFTLGQADVVAFHSDYIISADWKKNGAILQRLAIGWYTGKGEFGFARGCPLWFLKILEVFMLLGAARILFDGLARGRSAPEAPTTWGSRSLGSLASVCGLLVASPLMQYPAAEGRMTLFLLFHLHILILEGISFVSWQLDARLKWMRAPIPVGLVLCLLVAGGLAPAAMRNSSKALLRDAPSNIKPLVTLIRERPDLPVLVTACSEKQVATLPGGLGVSDVRVLPFSVDPARDLPRGQEVLLLNAFGARACRKMVRKLSNAATRVTELSDEDNTARLYLLEVPMTLEPQANGKEGVANPRPRGRGV